MHSLEQFIQHVSNCNITLSAIERTSLRQKAVARVIETYFTEVQPRAVLTQGSLEAGFFLGIQNTPIHRSTPEAFVLDEVFGENTFGSTHGTWTKTLFGNRNPHLNQSLIIKQTHAERAIYNAFFPEGGTGKIILSRLLQERVSGQTRGKNQITRLTYASPDAVNDFVRTLGKTYNQNVVLGTEGIYLRKATTYFRVTPQMLSGKGQVSTSNASSSAALAYENRAS